MFPAPKPTGTDSGDAAAAAAAAAADQPAHHGVRALRDGVSRPRARDDVQGRAVAGGQLVHEHVVLALGGEDGLVGRTRRRHGGRGALRCGSRPEVRGSCWLHQVGWDQRCSRLPRGRRQDRPLYQTSLRLGRVWVDGDRGPRRPRRAHHRRPPLHRPEHRGHVPGPGRRRPWSRARVLPGRLDLVVALSVVPQPPAVPLPPPPPGGPAGGRVPVPLGLRASGRPHPLHAHHRVSTFHVLQGVVGAHLPPVRGVVVQRHPGAGHPGLDVAAAAAVPGPGVPLSGAPHPLRGAVPPARHVRSPQRPVIGIPSVCR